VRLARSNARAIFGALAQLSGPPPSPPPAMPTLFRPGLRVTSGGERVMRHQAGSCAEPSDFPHASRCAPVRTTHTLQHQSRSSRRSTN